MSDVQTTDENGEGNKTLVDPTKPEDGAKKEIRRSHKANVEKPSTVAIVVMANETNFNLKRICARRGTSIRANWWSTARFRILNSKA